MAKYLILGRYTSQGARALARLADNIEMAHQVESFGARLLELYLTVGSYDLAVIVEAPDDKTVARLVVSIGTQGNIATHTLRAFSTEEAQKFIRAAQPECDA